MRLVLPLLTFLAACPSDPPTRGRSHASGSPAASVSTSPPSTSASAPSASATPSATATADPIDPTLAAQVITVPGLDAGPHPFVLFLHGLGGTGKSFASALGVAQLAADKKFLYASPDGAIDAKGRRFWNASSACCDFDHTGIDHVRSLGALIATARRLPSVDPTRVYVIGFSNGAFMAHRLGCSVPGIAAIVSVAGSAPNDGDPVCKPAAPVAALEIHGDADAAVPFDGGHVLRMTEVPAHRGALDTVALWSKIDGCASGPDEKGHLDLMASIPGAETIDLRYVGCKAPVALWRVTGGDHFIAASRQALEQVWTFLESVDKSR